MRSKRSEFYFQAEEAQGGSTTPALVRPHSGDLPPEHVQVRAEARGGRGGVREESKLRWPSSTAHCQLRSSSPTHWLFSCLHINFVNPKRSIKHS